MLDDMDLLVKVSTRTYKLVLLPVSQYRGIQRLQNEGLVNFKLVDDHWVIYVTPEGQRKLHEYRYYSSLTLEQKEAYRRATDEVQPSL